MIALCLRVMNPHYTMNINTKYTVYIGNYGDRERGGGKERETERERESNPAVARACPSEGKIISSSV